MDIQGVVFDLDDTLYDIAQPFFRAYERFYGEKYDLPMQKLFLSFRRYSDERFEDSQTGRMMMEDLYIYRIRMAMQEHGVKIDDSEALDFQQHYMEFQYQIRLSPIMSMFLDLLPPNMQVGIITNGESRHQRMKMKSLNLQQWISDQNSIVSGDYSFRKPDVRIFQEMEHQLNLTAEKLVYIGDSFDLDIVGAYRAGWKSIWFNHRWREIPKSTGIRPDIEVHTEEELSETVLRLSKK